MIEISTQISGIQSRNAKFSTVITDGSYKTIRHTKFIKSCYIIAYRSTENVQKPVAKYCPIILDFAIPERSN
jgi:hypothetical protein